MGPGENWEGRKAGVECERARWGSVFTGEEKEKRK